MGQRFNNNGRLSVCMMDREKASEAVRALCEHFGIEDDATDEYDGMDPYQILVSTIVSQQISEASTRRICSALFSEFPSMEDVRHADPVRFEEAIKASRYHHQKACCILSATRMIAEDFGGEVPDDFERLRSLPGVGDKTAACVMRHGFGKRTVIVDSHINRVSNRLGISCSKRPADTRKAIEETVPEEMWGLLDKGFIALGRTFCRPKGPSCEECPVNHLCEHNVGRQPDRRSRVLSSPHVDGPIPRWDETPYYAIIKHLYIRGSMAYHDRSRPPYGLLLTAMLLAVAFVALIMPFAEDCEARSSGTCGDGLSWTLDDSGVLTISGTGDMKDYSSGGPWGKSVRSVIVKDGATSVGKNAFRGCVSITSARIAGSVASIGDGAFYNCASLSSVTMGAGIRTIGGSAFYGCSSLASVSLPATLESIMSNAFYGCSSLASVSIPGSVTFIEQSAFVGCSSLASISVDAGNANYSSSAGVLFSKDKKSLKMYPAGKQSGRYAIPGTVESVENYAFYRCLGLTSVTMPDSVKVLGKYVFRGCDDLTSISVGSGNAKYSSAGGVLFSKDKMTLLVYPAGKQSIGYSFPARWRT